MSLLLVPTITSMPAHPLWYCANDKGKSNACIYKYYNDGTEPEIQKCFDDNLRSTYWMKKCYSERDECIRDCSMTACTGVDAICKGDTAKNFWDGVHKVWCYGTKDCTTPTPKKDGPIYTIKRVNTNVLKIGDTFEVEVGMESGEIKVAGADALLNYDNNKFDFVKVMPNTSNFPYEVSAFKASFPKINQVYVNMMLSDTESMLDAKVVSGAVFRLVFSVKKGGKSNLLFQCIDGMINDSNILEMSGSAPEDKIYCAGNQKLEIEVVGEGDVECKKKNGDYNGDGKVDGLDYSWWKQEFVDKLSHDGKWEAIPDCSGEVTTEGYSVWRYNYLE